MGYHDTDDNEGYETYLEHVADWAVEMFRVAGPQGRICLNVPLDTARDWDVAHQAGYFRPHPIYADWLMELLEAGWLYRQTIVWNDGFWTFPGAHRISEDHCPAPFPEELPRRCMRMFSFPNDVVLDPFLGSGTSGVVAAQCGRQFYGFDTSALYVEQSRERIADALRAVRRNGRQNGHVAQP